MGLMSQKTGVAPCITIEEAVAIKEKGVVTTLSPFLIPKQARAICKAEVPLFVAMANFVPM
ncbi:hypothetical protein ES703_50217 [subsurface metagenome]